MFSKQKKQLALHKLFLFIYLFFVFPQAMGDLCKILVPNRR